MDPPMDTEPVPFCTKAESMLAVLLKLKSPAFVMMQEPKEPAVVVTEPPKVTALPVIWIPFDPLVLRLPPRETLPVEVRAKEVAVSALLLILDELLIKRAPIRVLDPPAPVKVMPPVLPA